MFTPNSVNMRWKYRVSLLLCVNYDGNDKLVLRA